MAFLEVTLFYQYHLYVNFFDFSGGNLIFSK